MDQYQIKKDALEELIDNSSLHKVVELLAQVCAEKAQHISENWQDDVTARPWMAASKQFESLEQKIYKAGL